ncbi:hypothetical protein HYN48_13550 [Flavobacterium magnum]|uniref:Uncharacterized protein n=1 Tax=Flavobacterium magnum TaxID=2162713 RepID=A0A2S0RGZ9_9FLAO|nr:hypothetical protein [Flavobacterium magnum]AWA31023.1 hypothetical protein HYN48_13550 [Flavobacterium magnum]
MTNDEFLNVAKIKLFDNVFNISMSVFALCFSIFLQIKFFEAVTLEILQKHYFGIVVMYIMISSLLIFMLYALYIIVKPFKIQYVENNSTENQNSELIKEIYNFLKAKDFECQENVIQFTFKKNFWSYKHRFYFLVQDNSIGIYIKVIDSNPEGGFLDFGARLRLQKKIINLIKH